MGASHAPEVFDRRLAEISRLQVEARAQRRGLGRLFAAVPIPRPMSTAGPTRF